MQQRIAALNKKISFQTSKKISVSSKKRKAETRTKIQLGGLLIKSGLTDLFSIHIGSDLQLDMEEREKATLLLGALLDISNEVANLDAKKEKWELLGKSALTNSVANTKPKEGKVGRPFLDKRD